MTASLDPFARYTLDRRALLDLALQLAKPETVAKLAAMDDEQFIAAMKIIQDTALEYCGWQEIQKWN